MTNINLTKILKKFNIEYQISPYGNGHINDTYIAKCNPKYILQRINSNVFKNPKGVMDNIVSVTDYLRGKIIKDGGDPDRETLTVIKTIDGDNFYKFDDDNYFRVYKFIENAVAHDSVENPSQFYNAARAFGKFQMYLNDFPAEELNETIKDFHNTKVRYSNFIDAVQNDCVSRTAKVQKEINFALKRKKYIPVVVDLLQNGELPIRVTHNDTKLNNVMLDEKTGAPVCVIDLDTVMPGSMLYDFGDALRFGASSGEEDEKDLSKIYFDLSLYKSFAEGFLAEVKDVITPKEIELLPFSAILMTYECGIRFLEDYLRGDVYFKTAYSTHNLVRARTQFKLVQDMEEKMPEMKAIIKEIIK